MKWKFYTADEFGFAVKFGLHENPWLAEMHKIWRRYVAKTFSQEGAPWSWNYLADYGVSFIGWFGEKGKWGYGQLSVFDGQGGAAAPMDANNKKDLSLAAFFTPITDHEDFGNSKIGFHYYKGYDHDYTTYDDSLEDNYQRTLMSFMGNVQYRHLFSVGAEYNKHSLDDWYGEDNSANAISIYGTMWFDEIAEDNKALSNLALFFRYVMYDPNSDDDVTEATWNNMIFGVECSPVKGFAASLNYQTSTWDVDPDDVTVSILSFNTVIDF
jgi:hypothetical protein